MQDAFLKFYSQWYSPEALEALRRPGARCLRLHRSGRNPDAVSDALARQGIATDPLPWWPWARVLCDPHQRHAIDPDSRDYYWMDPASLLPVLALDVHPGQHVADFCAAPGGKAAFIADLMECRGTLLVNEFSSARFQKLRHTLKRFSLMDPREDWTLLLSASSARILPRQYAQAFDRILIDVPCSSEAHVLQDPKELALWTPSRSAALAKRQRKLLLAAVQCLNPGGRLVYSTCSISPLENEDNMAWFAKKMADVVHCIPYKPPVGQFQQFGTQLLPSCDGMGPMYFSAWERHHYTDI